MQSARALSRESGVAVAASTGYHLLGFYPADCWVHSLDEEGLYDLYCGELLEGMLPWRPERTARRRSRRPFGRAW